MRCLKILLFFLLITLLLISCQKNVNREKALELYQMGQQVLYYDGSLIGPGENRFDKAAPYFEQAIEMDSTFAPAYASLAHPYAAIKSREMSRAEAAVLAKKLIDKASALDPNLSDAYAALGNIQAYYEYNTKDAEKSLKKAIEMDPQNCEAHRRYADLLQQQLGKFEDALQEAKKAVDLDPANIQAEATLSVAYFYNGLYDEAIKLRQKLLNSSPNRIGWYAQQAQNYIMNNDFDNALEIAKKGLELNPNHPNLNWVAGWAYEEKGMYEKALEFYKKTGWKGQVAWIYAIMGKKSEAVEIVEELKKEKEQGGRTAFNIAFIYFALSQKENAIEWFEKGFEERKSGRGFGWYKFILNEVEGLDPLRSEPRFQALLDKINAHEI